MRHPLLAAVAASVAGTLLSLASPATAHEAAGTAGETTAACGYSDNLYLDAPDGDSAETCRYRSGLGTLEQHASTRGWGEPTMLHDVVFSNYSGRDIHLSVYRQGLRNGERINTRLAYNVLIPRGELHHELRLYSRHAYSNMRVFVKHHATGRTVYTPWINLVRCTAC